MHEQTMGQRAAPGRDAIGAGSSAGGLHARRESEDDARTVRVRGERVPAGGDGMLRGAGRAGLEVEEDGDRKDDVIAGRGT